MENQPGSQTQKIGSLICEKVEGTSEPEIPQESNQFFIPEVKCENYYPEDFNTSNIIEEIPKYILEKFPQQLKASTIFKKMENINNSQLSLTRFAQKRLSDPNDTGSKLLDEVSYKPEIDSVTGTKREYIKNPDTLLNLVRLKIDKINDETFTDGRWVTEATFPSDSLVNRSNVTLYLKTDEAKATEAAAKEKAEASVAAAAAAAKEKKDTADKAKIDAAAVKATQELTGKDDLGPRRRRVLGLSPNSLDLTDNQQEEADKLLHDIYTKMKIRMGTGDFTRLLHVKMGFDKMLNQSHLYEISQDQANKIHQNLTFISQNFRQAMADESTAGQAIRKKETTLVETVKTLITGIDLINNIPELDEGWQNVDDGDEYAAMINPISIRNDKINTLYRGLVELPALVPPEAGLGPLHGQEWEVWETELYNIGASDSLGWIEVKNYAQEQSSAAAGGNRKKHKRKPRKINKKSRKSIRKINRKSIRKSKRSIRKINRKKKSKTLRKRR